MTTTLVLLRHGESEWNEKNLFTGWIDVGLTQRGRDEARRGGEDMLAADLKIDVTHTSLQRRAIETCQIALDVLDRLWIPVRRSWRLNERHYGALQGLNKKETAEQHGADKVKIWRRSYDVPPPPLDSDDPTHPRHDPRYEGVPPDALPSTECLKDVLERMLPYWYDGIVPDLRSGATVLVAAHGNSLRALVKHLDQIPDDEITELNIPTGIPLVYELDNDMSPTGGPGASGVSGTFLGDPEAAKAAAEAVARQAG